MSADLTNRNGEGFKFSNVTWAKILSLAKYYGWKSKGTVDPWWKDEPDAPDWRGCYTSNDGQWVTREDALNMANSLDRAIEEMDGTSKKVSEDIAIDEDFKRAVLVTKELELFLGLSECSAKGDIDKQMLKDFIQFCRKGSFCIF